MKKRMTLNEMEKKAYLMYHGDGLVDLALGMVVLLFGLGMQFDQTLLAPIFAAVAYPVWMAAKKGITEKRLGYVEFSEARKGREKRGMLILFLLGCLVLLMGVGGYVAVTGGGAMGGLMRESGFILLGFIFGLMISSVGVVLGATRLHGYSLLVILSVIGAHLLELPRQVGIIVPGAIIVLLGLYMLVTFLLRYKGSSEGSSTDEA